MIGCPYTILIVTWNGDDLLGDCLRSIARAVVNRPPCVVVDNANLTSTRELCAGFGFVKYVPSKENLGFAGGNNLGLPFCKTDYICLLNNDTVIHEDSFSPLIEFMDAHPNVAVTQGTMKLPRCGGTLDDCGTRLKWYGIQHHRYFRKPDPGNLRPVRVFSAKGAFMMVRRSVIDKLGGVLFYDHFKSYYEETDFCHRVWLSGAEVWFVPTPPIDHLLGSTSSRFNNAEIWRQYIANIFFYFSVNFTVAGKIRILLPFIFVYLAYTLFSLISGRFAMFRAMLSVRAVNRARRTELLEARCNVAKFRKMSDGELLRQIMRDDD